MKRGILTGMFALFVAGSLIGYTQTPQVDDTGPEKVKKFNSEEIIVKDTKQQTGTVTVLSEKEIKDSPQTNLVDVINQHVPSFYTANDRVMGFGVAASGAAQMSLRGMGISGWGPTTGLPILINGLDTTTSIMGHPVADIFTMKNIDRIEILHGPQPVLYGSGALGGVINIITKRQETEGFNTEISGSYGNYNTTDNYLNHMGKIGIFDYGISYNFQKSDGDRSQRDINGFNMTSAYYNHNATARFGFQLGSNWYASVNGYLMKEKIHDPGSIYATPASLSGLETYDIQRDGVSANIMHKYDKYEGMLHVYYNRGIHIGEQTAKNADDYYQKDSSYGTRITETLRLFTGNSITIGGEAKSWGGSAKNPDNTTIPWLLAQGNYYVKDRYLTDVSFFGLVEQKLFDFLTISGGGRYTYDSKYGSVGAWQGGLLLYPIEGMKIHSAVACGFKLPDLRQLYLYGPYPVRDPNPYLSPETDLSVEFGIEQELFEMVTLSVTGYRMYTDNRITPFGTFPNNTWMNANRFFYDGIESSMRAVIMDMFQVRAGYSYIDNDHSLHQRLPYVPRHRFVGGISFDRYHTYAGLDCEYVKGVYNDTAGTQKLSDYLVVNARVACTFLDHYKVFANFYNITDRKYQTFYGYPMPGFHMLGGVSVTFL